MIFSSYKFIFIFFPIVYIVYSLLRHFGRITETKAFLVIASFVFYGSGDLRFLPVLMFTAVFNFFISRGICVCNERKRPKTSALLLVIGIIENLGLLFYFKYRNFFFENVNMLFGTDIVMKNIILPLGISFYTFQIIAYLADCKSGDAKKYSFLDYMVFVTFFPQLIVGPVVSHGDIIPKLERSNLLKVSGKNIMLGMCLFSIGCFKKIVIADPLITYASSFYGAETVGGFFEAWTAVISYTFAYYFDFSGYIDMALGLGLFFNIELPQNFNSPYKARNFADFWRRWNMTVSGFLNDNVFKNIFHFGNGVIKLIIATLITFIVSGIWHGAGWHFIAWGLVNGIFVCFANIMTLRRKKLPFALAWALTFFFSILVRVLFDANNITQAIEVYKVMFTGAPVSGFLEAAMTFAKDNAVTLLLIALSAFITFALKNTGELAEGFEPKPKYAVGCGVLLAASMFFMGHVSQFLYFQF